MSIPLTDPLNAYIGHGSSGILILGSDEKEWIWPGTYTHFGIVEMQLIACDSDYGSDKWKKNVSKSGILVTVEGAFSSSQMNLQIHSGE